MLHRLSFGKKKYRCGDCYSTDFDAEGNCLWGDLPKEAEQNNTTGAQLPKNLSESAVSIDVVELDPKAATLWLTEQEVEERLAELDAEGGWVCIECNGEGWISDRDGGDVCYCAAAKAKFPDVYADRFGYLEKEEELKDQESTPLDPNIREAVELWMGYWRQQPPEARAKRKGELLTRIFLASSDHVRKLGEATELAALWSFRPGGVRFCGHFFEYALPCGDEERTSQRKVPTFGNFLKRLRVERKLSLREVSRLAGLDHAYIYRLETGSKSAPSEEALVKLIKALKATDCQQRVLRFLIGRGQEDILLDLIDTAVIEKVV
jgi:hypothetical protein